MTRRRASTLALAVLAGGSCATAAGSRPTMPVAVAVAAQPCETPNRRLGLGVLVADGLVLTAAHVVDGAIRTVTVDGRIGRVVAVDERLDAALVATAPLDVRPAQLADEPLTATTATVSIIGPAAATPVRVERRVDLVVHDTTSRVDHRRRSVVLGTEVAHGTSGAPVVDATGRVVAMVTLTDAGDGETYATDAVELAPFVRTNARRDLASLDPPEVCS